MRSQARLLPYENPLKKRFGKEFFRGIPRVPGVYTMRGQADAILYIGKAKDLRARLGSYQRAQPEQVSRKVIRMIHLIRSIEWEPCESEEAALLRENHLLRSHRPPFNVVNVHPETYYFVGFQRSGHRFRFRLTTTHQKAPQNTGPEPVEGLSMDLTPVEDLAATDGERLFGAFKGRRSVRDGYSALLRLLWACHSSEDERFQFPSVLARTRTAYRFEWKMPDGVSPHPVSEDQLRDYERLIRRFLSGTSRSLLSHLTERLLANESIPRFIYHCIQEDLETLGRFYENGPRRNRRLKRYHSIPGSELIAQDRLDDLIVVFRSRSRRKSSQVSATSPVSESSPAAPVRSR